MTVHKNSILPLQVAAAVDLAMNDLGISSFELAKIMNARYTAVEYWRSVGLTPESKFFLPLCAELGLDPDGFGFEKKGSRSAGGRNGSKRGEN